MVTHRVTLSALLIVALLAPGVILAQPAAPQAASAPEAQAGSMLFVENTGQWPDAARFQVWGGPGTMWLAEEAVWITLVAKPLPSPLHPSPLSFEERGEGPGERGEVLGVNLKLTFVGANPQPLLIPSTSLQTKVSYFLGDDPSQWRPEVPVWSEVRYDELYSGVDLVLGDGASGALPWRLEAQPGANLSAVHLRVEGADSLALDGRLLRITTATGELALPLPAADFPFRVEAATTDGRLLSFDAAPTEVAGRQALDNSQHAPADNPAELLYGTFLGGSGVDYGGNALALDAAGRATVTGSTGSTDFPTTPGAFDPSSNGGYRDAFVVRLNAAGSALDYATFLGGGREDYAYALALDAYSRATVTGQTSSSDFPITPGAFDPSYNVGYEAFVVRLNAAGSALDYATFLGGSGGDFGLDLALDNGGRATVTGWTWSSDFPITPGVYDGTFGGGTCGTSPNTYPCPDAFVVRLNAVGSALDYATFLGSSRDDYGYALALDTSSRATVTGYTWSSDFPTTPGAFDTSHNGSFDAFVVQLSANGSTLDYATFLGGSGGDYGYALALDASNRATVTGYTLSSDFPTTSGAFDRSHNGGDDVFVVRLNAAGSALDYATFIGGNNGDHGCALALDASNRATLTGYTWSSDFPTTPGAFDGSLNAPINAFVVRLNANGSALDYATFLGGSGGDYGYALALDTAGRATVTGWTGSDDFPTTPGTYDPILNGADAFIAKLAMSAAPMPTHTPTRTTTRTPTNTPTRTPTTTATQAPTRTPTQTSTATPSSTPTPTSTPLGPWAAWHAGGAPLLVPPKGADAVADYGNMATPVRLVAHVFGAALFDTGPISGTTTISASLPTANGSYPLPLIPAIGATTGQTLTVRVDVGPVTLTKDGWISRPVYLPLLLRR